MNDDELLRRLRDHGRRLERDADALDNPTPARQEHAPRRRGVAFGGVAAVATTIAVVVIALVAHSHSDSHESVIVAPSTSVPSACVASPPVAASNIASPKPVYRALPLRTGAAIAYDPATRDVVLFGGYSRTTLDDTWLWDGQGWSQAHPNASPTPRENGTMAYDPATGQLVLFGGTQDVRLHNSIAHHDTWTWDGTTWTEQHPNHVPPWSTGFTMSYDPCSRSIILLTLPSDHPNVTATPNGGTVRGATAFGTWQWDGSDWHELPTPTAPSLVTAQAVGSDDPRLTPLPHGAGLLFYSWAVYTGSCPGGKAGPKGSPCNQLPDPTGTRDSRTWTWDGRAWTEQHPSRAPAGAVLVATPGADAAPTVFGPFGTPWRWTGSDWSQGKGSFPAPHDPEDLAVYDEADNNIVFVGNSYGPSPGFGTWTWNGTWTKRSPVITPAGAHQVPPSNCSTAHLTATSLWQGEEGGLRGDLTVRNTGAPCTLDIRNASLALLNRGVALPLQPEPPGQSHIFAPRVLENQGSADVLVFWSNWCKPVPGPMKVAFTVSGGGAPLTFEGGPLQRGRPFAPRCDAPESPSGIEVLGFTAP